MPAAPRAPARRYAAVRDADRFREQAEVGTYRRGIAKLRSAQLASIIYTSGTTGEPKGVMLSHANFVSNEMASFQNLAYGPDDLALSFLPLVARLRASHRLLLPVSRHSGRLRRPAGRCCARARGSPPDLAAAVPRFFEKLYATVMERGAQATGLRRHLFDWAVRTARRAIPWRAYGRPVSPLVKLQWELADRLVYKKFRAGVGGRIRLFISGGAPLATELAEFFTTVGLTISQGYGLTETSPVVSNNIVAPNHIGTVGHPIAATSKCASPTMAKFSSAGPAS